MKKVILLTILLFQITSVCGQDVKYDWGLWVQNPCFKGLQSRCKVKDYNNSTREYSWDIEIKNIYGSKVSFNFDIQNSSIDGRTSINPGGVDKSWTLNPSGTNLYIEFTKVCFDSNDYCSINSNGIQNKGYKCYGECDNGVPNIPNICGNTNSNNNSTNQNTNTQQNDLTEYNRSKAEIEQKMNAQNQEIQKQNQERAKQSQQFINVYNEGVDLGNTGKYAEAKAKYQQAIGIATTNEQRQQAQNSYDKMQKSQGTAEIVNVVGNTIQDFAVAFAQEKERKRIDAENDAIEKRQKEAAIAIKKQEAAEELSQQINNADNGDFEAQVNAGETLLKNKEYIKAQYFYEKALNNSTANGYKLYSVKKDLEIVYAMNKKEIELWDLIKYEDKNYVRNMLVLESDNYITKTIVTNKLIIKTLLTFVDIAKKERTEQLVNSQTLATYAYYLVTGKYSKDNLVPKNEEEGIKILEELTNNKRKYLNNSTAYYYLGLLYLEGTDKIKKNEDKAFDNFIYSIYANDLYISEKKDLVYVFGNHDSIREKLNYFNGAIKSYVQISKILSKSTREKDIYINKWMKKRFEERYINLVPDNERYLFY